MLECPYCHERVPQPGWGEWFRCPVCRIWLCPHRDQNGFRWIEVRVPIDEQSSSGGPPGGGGTPPLNHRPPSPPNTFQNVNGMTLTTVRAQRQENESRLRQLALDIRRVNNLLNQNRQNPQRSQQYNTELSRYTDEQRQRQRYAEQLNAREADLRVAPAPAPRPVTPPRRPDSSGAFVGGTALTAASIFIFTWMINLHLDPRAYMVLFLIALAAGALTWLVARSS